MQLRSGTIILDAGNVTVRKKKMSVSRHYKCFRKMCQDFIGELNDASCDIETIHILYRLYQYINQQIDKIVEYMTLQPTLSNFINSLIRNIPKHIQDVINSEKNDDIGITWTELTGTSVIEYARELYEMRLVLIGIVEM
jgi:cell fate (sporulation/competence/biofilm development) regulator YlbF (YheA/YmcA/DUF963 family)